jgi:hypothetical protein
VNLPAKRDPSIKSKLIAQHSQIVSAIARKTITIRRLERELDDAIEALASLQAQIEAEDATIN